MNCEWKIKVYAKFGIGPTLFPLVRSMGFIPSIVKWEIWFSSA